MNATPRPEPVDPGHPTFWPARALASLQSTQQQQWQALFAWQKAMAEIQSNWYDCWACRFADSARIDD